MKIAAAAYAPEWHPSWEAMAAKLNIWVAEAAANGADLLVFPEYAGMEACLLRDSFAPNLTPRAWVAAAQSQAEAWVALHQALAQEHGVHILSGSLPWPNGCNAAGLFSPNGDWVRQDKMIPTPYERNEMGIVAGDALQLIETPLGKIGILICYDSEFPLLARALVAAGADMILVPSCTDFPAGQTRVRQSCRARAIEGQCLIVQAPLVGMAEGCEIVDQNTGRVGFFCPPDHGLPSDGIIAQGATDVAGWTYAEVDPIAISAARTTGQVGNFHHWPEQDHRAQSVTLAQLR